VAVAIAGAAGLVRLAHHALTPRAEGSGGIVLHNEVISVWLHPAFLDLAHHPSESAACRSLEGLRRYAEARGLEKAWYVITVKGFQSNGETTVVSLIRRPYELVEPFYVEFPRILALAAGNPPRDPMTDFTRAKVGVIPDRLRDADPRAALDELRLMEDLPGQETATRAGGKGPGGTRRATGRSSSGEGSGRAQDDS
jgi:hypothetical protein